MRRVVLVERRPAERQRLERRAASASRVEAGVVRVDRVGDERSVAGDADVERAPASPPLTTIVSVMMRSGSCAPRNSAACPAASSRSR